MFTDEQRKTLMKYYDNGMKSTNRQHIDTIEKCAKECQTSVERIKVEMLDSACHVTSVLYYY